MSEAPDLSALRRQVFENVGRTVVMFQEIERMLKVLLNRGRIVATASELAAWKGKAPETFSKRMLGELIDPLIEHHLTPAPPDGMPLPESDEIVVGFEFRVGLTESQRETYRQWLESMVKQRNELIHHLLEWLRVDTTEACEEACRRLKQQRDELTPLHDDIRSILRSFLESRKGLVDQLERRAGKISGQP